MVHLSYRHWRINSLLEPESDVYQPDHHRHLDQGSDNRRKRRAGAEAEDRHCHGDRQLEVIAGRGEGEGSGLGIIRPDLVPHPEAYQEHDHEVNDQRGRDPHHIERDGHDQIAFKAEHDHDGKEQSDQGEGG